jgi:hypothetical protein
VDATTTAVAPTAHAGRSGTRIQGGIPMQKDFHFYVTYALARKAGYSAGDAATIAWADEYTDALTDEGVYQVQTQCGKLDRWNDPQIQLTVIVPFHFIPGDDEQWPWKTTQDSPRSRMLLTAAERSGDLRRLGVALHALQDTFSHQGFSGWMEKRNSCYPWYYLLSVLPNVGHTEMLAVPDMVDRVWYDPRTNKRIDNRRRAMAAAEATFKSLLRAREREAGAVKWRGLKPKLSTIFAMEDYDLRKDKLRRLSGEPDVDCKKTDETIGAKMKDAFIEAASAHLSAAVATFEGLPRVSPS